MEQNLISKIAKAALEVGGKLKADKTNKEQNYDYISADKILSDCGQALFTQGVVIIPDILAQEIVLHEYTDAYGKAKKRYDSRVDFIFHIADESTSYDAKWYGVGSDYSVPDKSLYKAITSGHKYFLMKLLCIGAGNEDGEHDADEGDKKQAKQTPANGHTPDADASKLKPLAKPTIDKPVNPITTIEQAEEEWSDTARTYYGSIDTPALVHMHDGLRKVKSPTNDQIRKLCALNLLIPARAKGRLVVPLQPMPDTPLATDAEQGELI